MEVGGIEEGTVIRKQRGMGGKGDGERRLNSAEIYQ